jgi:hypothetical protein
MNFQKQTKPNNCFDACVASILNEDLSLFPNYKGEGWEIKIQRWLTEKYNKSILFIEYTDYVLDSIPKDIPYIVSCELNEGGWHSRIFMNAELIFDPSPKIWPASAFRYDNMKAEFIIEVINSVCKHKYEYYVGDNFETVAVCKKCLNAYF